MSLKQELRKRILEDMIKGSRGDDEYVVLVVDEHTSRVLSSCCRMYDIMDAGVLVLENIMRDRQRLEMPAIYFLSPTQESIDRLILDFKNMQRPQYSSIFLYFTTRVDKLLMSDLAKSKVVPRIKVLRELNIEFVALESRVFHFDEKLTIPRLFFEDADYRDELKKAAAQLVSVCITLNEYPYIRYDTKSRLCTTLARFLEDELKKMVNMLPDWQFKSDQDRSTLLIVDRSLDPIAPLMHEYTYQAMLNDVLGVRGELIDLQEEKEDESAAAKKKKGSSNEGTGSIRTEVLSEDDPLWVEYRHKHIAEVLSMITQRFNEFRQTNAMAQLQSATASIHDMKNAMNSLPQYRELVKQFYKHMSIATQSLNVYENRHLSEVSELEQDMATGLDGNGDKVKSANITKAVASMCQAAHIGIMEKLRILFIYVMTQDAAADSIRQLMNSAGIGQRFQKAVLNLKFLGVDVHANRKDKTKLTKERMAQFANRIKATDLALMRFVPAIQEVMQSFAQDNLDRDAYPYVIDPPVREDTGNRRTTGSVQTNRRRGMWRHGGDKEKKEQHGDGAKGNGARNIVFMVGGMTFSEMRCAYEVTDAHDSNLFIGSPEILTWRSYLGSIANLGENETLESVMESKSRGRAADDDDDDDDDDGAARRKNAAKATTTTTEKPKSTDKAKASDKNKTKEKEKEKEKEKPAKKPVKKPVKKEESSDEDRDSLDDDDDDDDDDRTERKKKSRVKGRM